MALPAPPAGPRRAPQGVAASLSLWVQRLLGVGLLAIVAVNVANALGRHVFGVARLGTDEAMVFAMIWIVMIGAVLSLALRAHIGIDLLPGRLAGRTRYLLFALHDAVAMLGCGYVTWASYVFVSRIARLGTISMGLGIPMTVPHAALLIGFAAMTATAAVLFLRSVAGFLRPPAVPSAVPRTASGGAR